MLNQLAILALLASVLSPQSIQVKISATVGEFHFSIFGYTSPYAQVDLESRGVYEQTIANETGYFIFSKRFSPLQSQEVCLTAKDQFGRLSSPVCLPPFSIDKDVSIGPILMPPTISLDAQNYWQGDEIKLTGQTIPQSQVNFSTFVDEKKSLIDYLASSLIPPVEAFTFPQLLTVSDAKGNFSLAVPSSLPNFFRIFSQTNYLNAPSPASITLNLKILPIWLLIWLLIVQFLKSHILETIIVLQLILLTIFLLRRYLYPQAIARARALTIRPNLLPEEQEKHELLIRNESRRAI